MNVRPSAFAAAVTVILATVALTACSSNKTSAAGADTNSPTATPANTTPTAGDATNSSKGTSTPANPVDVCSLISVATAAQLSGQPYTTATPESGHFGSECAYNNDDSTAQGVNLSVDSQNVDNTWQLVHSGNVTDVSGIGDKAVWDNGNTLYAVSGGVIIQVNGLDSQAKSEALAKALLGALH